MRDCKKKCDVTSLRTVKRRHIFPQKAEKAFADVYDCAIIKCRNTLIAKRKERLC